MTDPAADAARTAAAILAPDLGPHLPAQVEAALAARNTPPRPDRYLDPISLATLIVTIATLAWTIYNDQRSRHPDPEPETIARQIRITLREQDTTLPPTTQRITEIIATEITRQTKPSQAQDKRLTRSPMVQSSVLAAITQRPAFIGEHR